MAKKVKAEQTTQAALPAAANATQTTLFKVLAPKGRLHEATKYGPEAELTFDGKVVTLPSGTEGTHRALAWAAEQYGGKLTEAQGRAICAARGDKGFWNYALKRLRVLQAVDPAGVAVTK